ncbi:MAG TPA: ABC transporter permease, partial [Candidatus Acidoferrales bacterium]|nr:ABC transporter permease [Candidatus Acidoferrales bacterium]
AILFGVFPAISIARGDLESSLRQGGRGVAGAWTRMRRGLVIVEVALAFILLFGSGLLMRSLAQLTDVKPGFEMGGRIVFSVSLPAARYKGAQQQVAFYNEAREKIATLPGIESASMTSLVPLNGDSSLWTIGINGQQNKTSLPSAEYYLVDPGYLRAMGIPLLQGREFTEQDTANSQHVLIINDYFAHTLFPGQNPIGQHVQLGRNYDVVREIVGVVASVKQEGLDDQDGYQVYEPFAQMPRAGMTFIVKSGARDAMSALPAVRSALKQIDPELPITHPETLEQEMGQSLAMPRFRTALLGIFAALAVILALLGLYGVMSYAVTEQTQEIGVRVALGAATRDIYSFVLGRGLTLVGLGICAGVAGAFAATKVLQSFLFGVTAHDAWTIAGVTALFAIVATAACLVPARRAAKVDPLVALRYQ